MLRQRTFNRTAAQQANPITRPDFTQTTRGDARAPIVRERSRDRIAILTGIMFSLMAIVTTTGWFVLLQWFDLGEKLQIRYDAFEKVPGQFDSGTMHRTLAIFIGVCLLYVGGALVIARTWQLTTSIKAGALCCMAGPAIVNLFLYPAAAIYAMRQSRGGWLAAPALACSVLVKLFTGVLAPLFMLEAVRGRWSMRKIALAVVATAAVVVAVVAPFWDGGDLWIGMREGTRLGQRMDHVSPRSLAQQQQKEDFVSAVPYRRYLRPYASSDVLPQAAQDKLHRQFTVAFIVLTALVLAARLKAWVSFERAAALILILCSLLMTNLYPWYLIPIIALLALDGEALGIAFVFVATLLGLVYYPAYVWAHFNTDVPLFQVHLYLAIFLTAPMVAFLVVEVLRITRVASTRGTRHSIGRRATAGPESSS